MQVFARLKALSMTATALIVAAGKGERAGGPVPKQFQRVAGHSVLAHCVDHFRGHSAISSIILVVAPNGSEQALSALGGRQVNAIIEGGPTRQASVHNGLTAIAGLGGTDHVFIHDAARPIVPPDVIDRLMSALEIAPGAIPVLPVVDTIVTGSSKVETIVPRETLNRVQTPQAFHFEKILKAHQDASDERATDDAQMMRASGHDVVMVLGDPKLEKLTHEADFDRLEYFMTQGMISHTGMGFDVHRLEAGTPLWLCGVEIPHDQGLAGHSDADVALHALVDALLGTIGAGDIGTHFPPSDPQWRGAASSLFVQHARQLINDAGGIIDHVDLTIICEAPKIGPHRDAMRTRIADMLQVAPSQVSIKATTTEGLGFTGRGEGIAAQAVATVRVGGKKL